MRVLKQGIERVQYEKRKRGGQRVLMLIEAGAEGEGQIRASIILIEPAVPIEPAILTELAVPIGPIAPIGLIVLVESIVSIVLNGPIILGELIVPFLSLPPVARSCSTLCNIVCRTVSVPAVLQSPWESGLPDRQQLSPSCVVLLLAF